jgi:hypothetical protein
MANDGLRDTDISSIIRSTAWLLVAIPSSDFGTGDKRDGYQVYIMTMGQRDSSRQDFAEEIDESRKLGDCMAVFGDGLNVQASLPGNPLP